jgi:hypothetical protein
MKILALEVGRMCSCGNEDGDSLSRAEESLTWVVNIATVA